MPIFTEIKFSKFYEDDSGERLYLKYVVNDKGKDEVSIFSVGEKVSFDVEDIPFIIECLERINKEFEPE